jgi:predicted  nucleic acid-binding Zn-ribbon protein
MSMPLEVVWRVIEGLIVVSGAGFALFYLNRNAYVKTLEKAVEGWKTLAELRNQEIGELKQRVATLESELRRILAENEQLRTLNLGYQAQIIEMQARIRHLEEARKERGDDR